MEGQNRNLGTYYNKIPKAGPDTDSIEINLTSQGDNVTPDLRLRHTRMIYQVPALSEGTGTIIINSPINWADDSLHTLLLDNSSRAVATEFIFSPDYKFLDNNPLGSVSVSISAGDRGAFYLSIISGKMYVKTMLNSDVISYI